MLNPNDDRTINANVDEVLEALRINLAEHKEIVEEARKGYIVKCKELLIDAQEKIATRLDKLDKDGLPPVMDAIGFHLLAPQDHSKEFSTVIKMLELHKNAHESNPANQGHSREALGLKTPPTIALKSADVQKYVLNDWSWMDTFLLSNAGYSTKSRAIATEKGLV